MLAGRKALQTGRPTDAIGYLKRAADLAPNYNTPYRVGTGVLSYLGRAYYESGRDAEARQALEQAVSLDQNDPLAHLYHGLTLLRKGDGERGHKEEVETGLKAIGDTLERAIPELYRCFAALTPLFGSDAESKAIALLYARLQEANFSHQVLALKPERRAVLKVTAVRRNDLGEPKRVMASLDIAGVRPRWAETGLPQFA